MIQLDLQRDSMKILSEITARFDVLKRDVEKAKNKNAEAKEPYSQCKAMEEANHCLYEFVRLNKRSQL